jgi:hypothetical protein
VWRALLRILLPNLDNARRKTRDYPTRRVVKNQYDIQTAITFLMIGLGAGAAMAIVMRPRQASPAQELKSPRRLSLTAGQSQN